MKFDRSLTRDVAAKCIKLRDNGNNHPNIRDIEIEYVSALRAKSDPNTVSQLVDADFYKNLRFQIESAFRKLRVYFFKYNVIVVPYNYNWHDADYVKPESEFAALTYLTGPNFPIYGIYFVVDKSDTGDKMYLAYCNREDGKETNKGRWNYRRLDLGVTQDVIPEPHVTKRIKNHSEKNIAQLTRDIERIQKLIEAKKKNKKST